MDDEAVKKSDEAINRSFELAQDTSKQIITLAAGIIALTITFFKDFAGGGSTCARVVMAIAWVLFFFAIVAGVLHLAALTASSTDPTPSIYDRDARTYAGAQQLLAGGGLILTILAGGLALASPSNTAPAPMPSVISITPSTITVAPSTITVAPSTITVAPSTITFAPRSDPSIPGNPSETELPPSRGK